MQTLISLCTLIIAVAIGVSILNICLKNANNIVYVLASVYLYEILAHLFSFSITLVSFGPFRLGPSDLLYILMLLIVFIPTLRHHSSGIDRKNLLYILYFVFEVIFFFSLIRGLIASNSSSDITTDIRRFYCFLVPMMYMLNTDINMSNQRTVKFINNFMTLILAFCYIMWGIIVTFGMRLDVTQNEGGTFLRIMGPETTLVMVIWVLYLISIDLKKRGSISLKALFGCLAIIIMQQRTVWVCFFAGLIVLFINYRKVAGIQRKWTINKRLFFQCVTLACLIVIVLNFNSDVGIIEDIKNSASSFSDLEDSATFSYRMRLWSAHLQTLQGSDAILGKEFGAGYLVDLGYSRDITPHNGYVHTALRTGSIGVIILLLFIISLIEKGVKKNIYSAVIIGTMVLIYFIGYTYTWYIGVAIGYCMRQVLCINKECNCFNRVSGGSYLYETRY